VLTSWLTRAQSFDSFLEIYACQNYKDLGYKLGVCTETIENFKLIDSKIHRKVDSWVDAVSLHKTDSKADFCSLANDDFETMMKKLKKQIKSLKVRLYEETDELVKRSSVFFVPSKSREMAEDVRTLDRRSNKRLAEVELSNSSLQELAKVESDCENKELTEGASLGRMAKDLGFVAKAKHGSPQGGAKVSSLQRKTSLNSPSAKIPFPFQNKQGKMADESHSKSSGSNSSMLPKQRTSRHPDLLSVDRSKQENSPSVAKKTGKVCQRQDKVDSPNQVIESCLLDTSDVDKIEVSAEPQSLTFNLQSDFKINKENLNKTSYDNVTNEMQSKLLVSSKSNNSQNRNLIPHKMQKSEMHNGSQLKTATINSFKSAERYSTRKQPQQVDLVGTELLNRPFPQNKNSNTVSGHPKGSLGFANEMSSPAKGSPSCFMLEGQSGNWASDSKKVVALLTLRASKMISVQTSDKFSNNRITQQIKSGPKFDFLLNLSNLAITDKDLVQLFKQKQLFADRSDINLSGNDITDDGFSIFLHQMSQMKLKFGNINFSKNKLSEKSLELVLFFLRNFKNELTDIEMSKNPIKNDERTSVLITAISNEGAIVKI
jgi:hypothetical protein